MNFRNFKLSDKLLKKNIDRSNFKDYKIYRPARPLRPSALKKFGYRQTPQYFSAIVEINTGGISPSGQDSGRKPSNIYRKFSRDISKINICKAELQKKYLNYKIIGGYEAYSDSKKIWFEFALKKNEQ